MSYFRQIVAANIACFSSLLAGCWISWASVAISKLMEGEPDTDNVGYRLSKYEISWMACLLDLGNGSSPILASLLMYKIGRKKTLLLSSLFNCVPILILFYQDVLVLYIARFSVGFGKGMALTVLPPYISELADTRIRGTLVSLVSGHMFVGLLTVLCVGPIISIRTLNISLCVVPFIFLSLFSFIPESPYHLIAVNKIEEAEKTLKWFRGNENVNEEFVSMLKKSKSDMHQTSSFSHLFGTPENRKAILIVLVTSGLQRACGITSLIVYGPKTFPETKIKWFGRAQSPIILMATLCVATIVQFRLSDIIGRRSLLGFSAISGSMIFFFISIYFMFPSIDYSFVVYILLILYGLAYYGISTVPSVLVGELFPMNVRCQASSLSAVAMSAGGFITNKFHLLIVSFTNTCVVFLIYSFIHLVIFLFTVKYVFETRCKTFEEIQDLLKKSVNKR